MRIETKILTNLIYDEHYCRKVIPFIKTDYFSERKEAILSFLRLVDETSFTETCPLHH